MSVIVVGTMAFDAIETPFGKTDKIVGGSIVEEGTLKAQVVAVGADTVLSNILDLVKKAQGEKPPVQQLADRISAISIRL